MLISINHQVKLSKPRGAYCIQNYIYRLHETNKSFSNVGACKDLGMDDQ